jgi:hypothetical protein
MAKQLQKAYKNEGIWKENSEKIFCLRSKKYLEGA